MNFVRQACLYRCYFSKIHSGKSFTKNPIKAFPTPDLCCEAAFSSANPRASAASAAYFLCMGLRNRVGKSHLPLFAARPARRFSGIFLCAGLCIDKPAERPYLSGFCRFCGVAAHREPMNKKFFQCDICCVFYILGSVLHCIAMAAVPQVIRPL